jgi:endonuclease/exonuclease/phosphatase family metal-dependent hydrolase
MLPFAVIAWFFFRRWVWIYLPLLLLHLLLGMGWRVSLSQPVEFNEPLSVRVMSFNRGQHSSYSLQPFKTNEKPDVILLQEAERREANYRRSEGYKEYPHIAAKGEFIVLSKWPILESSEVRSPQRVVFGTSKERMKIRGDLVEGDLLAMRLELELPGGKRFALYNVHFPTPRDILNDSKRGGFLSGILGFPGTPLAEKRKLYEAYWMERVKQSEGFIDAVSKDPLPKIIAGDFNMPSNGYVYRLFAERWKDAHTEAGDGFGYTFPGSTRNPLSLGSAWLRLDYIFSSQGWDVARLNIDKKGNSQHRPISATLVLRESP